MRRRGGQIGLRRIAAPLYTAKEARLIYEKAKVYYDGSHHIAILASYTHLTLPSNREVSLPANGIVLKTEDDVLQKKDRARREQVE